MQRNIQQMPDMTDDTRILASRRSILNTAASIAAGGAALPAMTATPEIKQADPPEKFGAAPQTVVAPYTPATISLVVTVNARPVPLASIG